MLPPSQAACSTIWKPGSDDIEAEPDEEREDEGDERRPERDVIDVPPRRGPVAANGEDEQRADQRQEGDGGKDRPVGHGQAANSM